MAVAEQPVFYMWLCMDNDFSAWVGRKQAAEDVLNPARTNALLAALSKSDKLSNGDPLPLLYHWLYFWNVEPPSRLGADGHPAKGDFLPPVNLPRRMWAGGRLAFHAPLLLGEPVLRVSTIIDVKSKSGKSGNLVFVTVQHDLSREGKLAIREEQDIVYREPSVAASVAPTADTSEAPRARWHQMTKPDTVLLFRYSALTMNGHRIHYDRTYAQQEEGYPGLVVHGPLQATLLADLAVKHLKQPLKHFSFRGQSPAFDQMTLHSCGEQTSSGADLWTEQAGTRCMTASASCENPAANLL